MTTARILLSFPVLLFLLAACQAEAQWAQFDGRTGEVYPDKHWAKASDPEALGWSSKRLAEARTFSQQIGSSAVMIVHRGVVIDAWGAITTKSNLHSVRKSLLSGLIGIAVDKGEIDLDASMGDLGIDDNAPSLTDIEKEATVRDLIKARSGIYHPALYETPEMTASKPPRGSHEPGSFWHYNNWDFNTLGSIYEQASGRKIFEAFREDFADPLQMEDYKISDGEYVTGAQSIHAAYPFRMTARDLARFALLYLREGRWKDRQIISKQWVAESTASHSKTGRQSGYGYMWWTGEDRGLFRNVKVKGHSFFASGFRRQLAIVLPAYDLVVVHRINTDRSGANPSTREIGRLLWTILAAGDFEGIGPNPALTGAKGRHLVGKRLRAFLPGKRFLRPRFRGRKWEIQVSKGGRMKRFPRDDDGKTEGGTWRIDGDFFCRRWEEPSRGRESCFSLVVDRDNLRIYDRQGTFVARLKILP